MVAHFDARAIENAYGKEKASIKIFREYAYSDEEMLELDYRLWEFLDNKVSPLTAKNSGKFSPREFFDRYDRWVLNDKFKFAAKYFYLDYVGLKKLYEKGVALMELKETGATIKE